MVDQNIGAGVDISILELEEELDLAVYTPACLAQAGDAATFDGQVAVVAGWGVTSEGGPFPDPFVPHEVEVPVIPAADCYWSSSSNSEAGQQTGAFLTLCNLVVIKILKLNAASCREPRGHDYLCWL